MRSFAVECPFGASLWLFEAELLPRREQLDRLRMRRSRVSGRFACESRRRNHADTCGPAPENSSRLLDSSSTPWRRTPAVRESFDAEHSCSPSAPRRVPAVPEAGGFELLPAFAVDVRPFTRRLARRDFDRVPVVVQPFDQAVDPAEAECFAYEVFIRHRLDACVLLVPHEPDAGARRVVLGEPRRHSSRVRTSSVIRSGAIFVGRIASIRRDSNGVIVTA